MPFKATKQQQNAIEGKGALLVSAAAGSGKTAVLVERVIEKLTSRDHPAEIDRLLIVTFTKAAAAEMRARIAKRLSEELARSPGNRQLIRQQLLLPKANICTIDSFCKNLLSENFETLGLPPDFRLISESQLAIVKDDAMEETLEHFLQTDSKAFSQLMRLTGTESDLKSIKSDISLIYEYLRTLPFPELWEKHAIEMYARFRSPAASPWGQKIMAGLSFEASSLLATIEKILSDSKRDPVLWEKRGPALADAVSRLVAFSAALDCSDWDGVCEKAAALGRLSWGTVIGSKCVVDLPLKTKTETAQAMFNQFSAKAAALSAFSEKSCIQSARALLAPVSLLLSAVNYYHKLILQKKAEKSQLDFADLEYNVLRLLVKQTGETIEKTPLAAALSARFDEVLVDEYQDTNDLQNTIFRILSDDGKKLFAVGDVKQSIYGFRRSNPENFMRMLDEYPDFDHTTSPAKIILSENFRSRAGICDSVNFIFSRILSKSCGDIDYDQSHVLNPSASFPERDEAEVGVEFIELADDPRTIPELESDRIAEQIRDMMQRACISENGTLRKARFSDFAILMRSTKNKAAAYAARLASHGIPAIFEQAEDFFQIPEVSRVISLLKVINNPLDDVAMLSTLLSPLFGFTAEETAKLRIHCRKGNLYTALLKAKEAGDEKCRAFLNELQYYRRLAALYPADKLIARIFDRTGFLDAVQVCENGDRKRLNLLNLLDIARACVQEGFLRPYEFLRYVERVKSGEIKIPLRFSGASAEDAVKIMSIHHSKGLQFPVCFVADCSKSFHLRDISAPFQLDQELGIGLKVFDPARRTKSSTLMLEAIKAEKRRSYISEELRILYVAATRAKENLILLCCQENTQKLAVKCAAALSGDWGQRNAPIDPGLVVSSSSFSELLLYCCLLHPSGKELRQLCEAGITPDDGEEDCLSVKLLKAQNVSPAPEPELPAEIPERPADPKLKAEIDRRLSYQNPYRALARLSSKFSVSQLTRKTAPHSGCTLRPAFLKGERLNAAERGTALHEFMQYADFVLAETDLEQEISRLVKDQFLTKLQGDSIDREKLNAFFKSRLYTRMRLAEKNEKLFREERFIIEIPAGRIDPCLPKPLRDEGIAVQGIADCVFIENGKLVIVDYKTDAVENAQTLIDRYASQLAIYAEAFEKLYGLPVEEKLIYAFSLGQTIKI